ncbi:cupin domain-containing protein [Pedobacter sp. HDW13]|uniref:cupin domain-containing protein n=1 Tax=Pedobacter sp. HDW13 TaxID=2714940 RepID=UPI0014073101|nr:cupin domain-containing protein [Pedobacter sp. HDW13]QIL41522.1 cupin domain-containing protein [Pedobacter sp. HDW13]
MKTIKQAGLWIVFPLCLFSCTQDSKISQNVKTEDAVVFAKGKRVTNDNFSGAVYLQPLIESDSLNQNNVGNVTFEPGARSKWHAHPAGQILLVTGGVGYYQEKGNQKIILRKGDVIKCPPNIPHWHGASADIAFCQVAITGREKGPTVWLEAVSDSVYLAGAK